MTEATAEDRAAVRRLMGDDWRTEEEGIGIGPSKKAIRWWWTQGSKGPRVVEEREDTRNGGTYMWCGCPGWPFQKGKGQDCNHVTQARASSVSMIRTFQCDDQGRTSGIRCQWADGTAGLCCGSDDR